MKLYLEKKSLKEIEIPKKALVLRRLGALTTVKCPGSSFKQAPSNAFRRSIIWPLHKHFTTKVCVHPPKHTHIWTLKYTNNHAETHTHTFTSRSFQLFDSGPILTPTIDKIAHSCFDSWVHCLKLTQETDGCRERELWSNFTFLKLLR